MVVGQAGLLALGPGVSAEEVEGWIGEARDFAAEWGELRAVHQNQLAGTPLRCPLQVRAPAGNAHPRGTYLLPHATPAERRGILAWECIVWSSELLGACFESMPNAII